MPATDARLAPRARTRADVLAVVKDLRNIFDDHGRRPCEHGLAMLPEPQSSNFKAMFPSCPAEPCLAGVTPQEYNRAITYPNPAAEVHVANNDFAWTGEQGVPCCWAEQSLKSVERTLHEAWGLGAVLKR